MKPQNNARRQAYTGAAQVKHQVAGPEKAEWDRQDDPEECRHQCEHDGLIHFIERQEERRARQQAPVRILANRLKLIIEAKPAFGR